MNIRSVIGLLGTIALCAMSAGMACAASGDPGTGIYYSPHDLTHGPGGGGGFPSLLGWTADPQQRLCAYCHTPHHANQIKYGENEYVPLWSRAISKGEYTPYASATFSVMGGTTLASDPLIGPSRLCMSCHDGVTAVDNYYGKVDGFVKLTNSGTTYQTMPVVGNSTPVANGSMNHPIGFMMTDVIPGYPGASYADPDIWSMGVNPNFYYVGNTGNPTLSVFKRLYLGVYLTCSTCHDVHNSLNKLTDIQPSGKNMLLLGTQKNSGICVTCHT